MTSLSEIPVMRVPADSGVGATGDPFGPSIRAWEPVELPRGRRPSPIVLVTLALVAGIGALALGTAAAVVAASDDDGKPVVVSPLTPAKAAGAASAGVEQRALALLAKPSTERVTFRGSGGHLSLAVGSGGRAAILIRGFPRANAARPYVAWVVGLGRKVRAARFVGTERAVFLDVALRSQDSVVITRGQAAVPRAAAARVVALRS
jgi:hypothetical protein